MTDLQDVAAAFVVGMLIGGLVATVAIAGTAPPSGQVTTTSVSKTSTTLSQSSGSPDYFNMTCAQLRDSINYHLNHPDFYYADYGFTPSAVNPITGYLLQLYQIKGCPA